jgi:RHS repeat-associated protein
MTWDKESRMLTNSLANASYVYNGFDARVSKTVSSTTTTFKRAGADPVSPVLSDIVGSTTTNYLPGISSRVGSTSTFNHSGIKNGILQTNSSQSSTATKRYDAFGNQLATSGTWQTRFDYGGGFGYQRDDESDYKLLGHRYYDPEIGRFLTRDSAKDGRNWYVYCDNNPVTKSDPDGERWRDLVWVFIAILDAIGDGAGSPVGQDRWFDADVGSRPLSTTGSPMSRKLQLAIDPNKTQELPPGYRPRVGPIPKSRALVPRGSSAIVPYKGGTGLRSTGSGGALGSIGTAVVGAAVLAEGIGTIIHIETDCRHISMTASMAGTGAMFMNLPTLTRHGIS